MSVDYKKHDPYVRKQNGKLVQVVQNFFSKFVQVILESRSDDEHYEQQSDASGKLTKWFNLHISNTAHYDNLKDDIMYWKRHDLSSMPPMIIETYLDLKKLSSNQVVLLRDENDHEWPVKTAKKQEVVLERWLVEFDANDVSGSILEEVPSIYKQAIVLLRIIYGFARLTPTFRLKKRLSMSSGNNTLLLKNKILDGSQIIRSKGRIGLSKPIIPHDYLATGSHVSQKFFSPIRTSMGTLKVSVSHRIHTNFIVRSNSEELLSSHFISMDSTNEEAPELKEKKASVKEVYNVPANKRLSISSYNSTSVSPHSSSIRESSPSYKAQKSPAPSRPSIQPFKVGSLSSSPPSQSPLSTTSVNLSLSQNQQIQPQVGSLERRISITSSKSTSNASLAALLRNPRGSASSSNTPNIPIATTPNQYSSFPRSVSSSHGGDDMGDTPNTPRFSSSFGSRASRRFSNSSLRHTTQSTHDSYLSTSAGSATSSGAPTSGLYIDDDISDFVRMIDSKSELRVGGGTGAGGDLSKFQSLRSQHDQLGDSVSASIIIHNPQQLAGSGMSRTSSRKSSHSRYSPPTSLHSGSYDPHLPSISSRLREISPSPVDSRTYSSRASQEPEERRGSGLPYSSLHNNASFLKSSSTNRLIATPIISSAQATLQGMLSNSMSKTTVTNKKRNSIGDVSGLATTPSAYEQQYANVFDDDDEHEEADWEEYARQRRQIGTSSSKRGSHGEQHDHRLQSGQQGRHHDDALEHHHHHHSSTQPHIEEEDDDLLFTMSDMNLTKD